MNIDFSTILAAVIIRDGNAVNAPIPIQLILLENGYKHMEIKTSVAKNV